MATKKPIVGHDASPADDGVVQAPSVASAKPRRSSTRPISARVDAETFALIEEAAARREMTRSELIELALLQFIGKGHAGGLKARVIVPGEVRREVRSAQETMDTLSVAMNRVGKNLLTQLKRHWSDEASATGEAALRELQQADESMKAMRTQLDHVAGQLRTVMDRSQW